MKKGMIMVFFLGSSSGDLEAAEGKTRRYTFPVALITSHEEPAEPSRLTTRDMPLALERLCMRNDFKYFSPADYKNSFGDDEELQYPQDLKRYTGEREWEDPDNRRHYCWIPQIGVLDGGRAFSLAFHPPSGRSRRYFIQLQNGVSLLHHAGQVEGFTVDMTRFAFLWGDRAWRKFQEGELNKLLGDESIFAQRHRLNSDVERSLHASGRDIVRLYGKTFPADASGRFIFFICRVKKEGDPRPVTLQAELGTIGDIDEWFLVELYNAQVGVADAYIKSVSMEFV